MIHAGHFGDHGFPAKLVGIILRQWRARVTVLADGRREMNGPRKSNELCGADHGRNQWQEHQRRNHEHQDKHGLQPSASSVPDPFCADYGPSREEHGIRRSDVVILAMQNHEDGERDQVGPAKNAVASSFTAKEQPGQSRQPQRKREGIHHQDLPQQEVNGIQFNVAAAGVDVVH